MAKVRTSPYPSCALEAQASNMAVDIGKMRWMMVEQGSTSVSMPLLAVLVFRLALVFARFGLFALPM